MKLQKIKAKKIQLQPPVEAYILTEENIHWLDENITQAGLLSDGSGLNLRSRFGNSPCNIGMVIIVTSVGRCIGMSQKKFEELYQQVEEEWIEV